MLHMCKNLVWEFKMGIYHVYTSCYGYLGYIPTYFIPYITHAYSAPYSANTWYGILV